MRFAMCLFVVLGCGGSEPEPEPQPQPQPVASSGAEARLLSPEPVPQESPCGPEGMPPEPPTAPLAIQNAEPLYQDALVTAPEPPASLEIEDYNAWARSTLTPWVGEFSPKVSRLQASMENRPRPEMALIGLWVARAYAVFVEVFLTIPPPASVSSDPEVSRVYHDAIRNQMQPLLERALEMAQMATAEVALPDWQAFGNELVAWLQRQQCALNP